MSLAIGTHLLSTMLSSWPANPLSRRDDAVTCITRMDNVELGPPVGDVTFVALRNRG